MSQNIRLLACSALLSLIGGAFQPLVSHGQQAGYQPPNFAQMGSGGAMHRDSNVSPAYAPPFPASPLAGGMPAAQGDSFMDASGNSIVLTQAYEQMCPPGAMGGGGYGDPMAIDFGGYGEEQVGPHYFDIAFETVFLIQEDLAGAGLPSLSSDGNGVSAGVTNNPVLNINNSGDEVSPGFRAAVRYDIGALSVLEATYTGLYDLGFDETATPSAGNQLISIYSNYGFAATGDGFITGLDEASSQSVSYESDLQSTELSYRRYWVGNNPRVSGTYLMGFRYTRMTEDFVFSAVTLDGNGSVGTSSKNDLLGFQFGGDAWIGLRQGLRLGVTGKTGVYNNRFKFSTAINNVAETALNVQPDQDGNQVAFIADGGVSMVADILPSVSLKGGYEVLYLNSLVTVQGNINTDIYNGAVTAAPALGTEGHVLYHGFHGGIEYVW